MTTTPTTDRPSPSNASAPTAAPAIAPAGAEISTADDDDLELEPSSPAAENARAWQHELCEAWAAWSRSRRLYGPPQGLPTNLLERMRSPTRPTSREGRDAVASSRLAAMQRAVAAQPDGRDKDVFLAFYVHRARNIKALAARVGLSRQRMYQVRDRFRERACTAAVQIEAREREAAEALSSRAAAGTLAGLHPGDQRDAGNRAASTIESGQSPQAARGRW